MHSTIGTLQESSLHAALKTHYAQPGDEIEVEVEGYFIDIKRGDKLIEIQTGSFSNIKSKLDTLLAQFELHLIHPIAQARWIKRVDEQDKQLNRRKSPKQGRLEDLFRELLRIPAQAAHPNFQLHIALIHEEVVWRDDGKGSWRRKGWSVADKHLLEVIDTVPFEQPRAYLDLLPTDLATPFTNKELSKALNIRRNLAGKMSYTLRKMDLLEEVGKRGRALLLQPKH